MTEIEIKLDPVFSSPVASIKADINIKKILKIAEKEKYNVAGRKDSFKNHVSQSNNMIILDKKIFKNEKKTMENYINYYCKNVLKYVNKLKLTTSWFTKAEYNQTSDPHDHSNSFLSAVLYLKTTKGCGGIVFKNFRIPSYIYMSRSEYNIWNADAWTIIPDDGLLLIFPSYLHHKILPGQNSEPRYSLAMNFFPIGKIGYNESDSFINIKDVDGNYND